jgi:hypothetical protein
MDASRCEARKKIEIHFIDAALECGKNESIIIFESVGLDR